MGETGALRDEIDLDADEGREGRRSELRERETTPAPPSQSAISASALDPEALAAAGSLPLAARSGLPLDTTVPRRIAAPAPDGLAIRVAFVLCHVDGVSSIRRIAATAELPIADVIACFMELAALGLVDLAQAR